MPDRRELYAGKYLRAEDVKERPFRGVVERVEEEVLNDGREKLVLYFGGRKRGLVLNGTRYDQVVALTKSHDTDDWPGTPFIVYASKTKMNGKAVDCLALGNAQTKTAARKRKEVKDVLDGDDLPEERGDELPPDMQRDADDDI
jgi:hypothetical protein